MTSAPPSGPSGPSEPSGSAAPEFIAPGFIVLVGMMGAGKTSVGRKLAEHYGVAFVDADDEIVDAAGCSIQDIFKNYGEPAFRDVEERVITRILSEEPQILATGGGAFMNDTIRALVKKTAVSIWLKAELAVLLQRTSRRDDRPLLQARGPGNNHREDVLRKLSAERDPIYAKADIIIETRNESLTETLNKIITSLDKRAAAQDGAHDHDRP